MNSENIADEILKLLMNNTRSVFGTLEVSNILKVTEQEVEEAIGILNESGYVTISKGDVENRLSFCLRDGANAMLDTFVSSGGFTHRKQTDKQELQRQQEYQQISTTQALLSIKSWRRV